MHAQPTSCRSSLQISFRLCRSQHPSWSLLAPRHRKDCPPCRKDLHRKVVSNTAVSRPVGFLDNLPRMRASTGRQSSPPRRSGACWQHWARRAGEWEHDDLHFDVLEKGNTKLFWRSTSWRSGEWYGTGVPKSLSLTYSLKCYCSPCVFSSLKCSCSSSGFSSFEVLTALLRAGLAALRLSRSSLSLFLMEFSSESCRSEWWFSISGRPPIQHQTAASLISVAVNAELTARQIKCRNEEYEPKAVTGHSQRERSASKNYDNTQ